MFPGARSLQNLCKRWRWFSGSRFAQRAAARIEFYQKPGESLGQAAQGGVPLDRAGNGHNANDARRQLFRGRLARNHGPRLKLDQQLIPFGIDAGSGKPHPLRGDVQSHGFLCPRVRREAEGYRDANRCARGAAAFASRLGTGAVGGDSRLQMDGHEVELIGLVLDSGNPRRGLRQIRRLRRIKGKTNPEGRVRTTSIGRTDQQSAARNIERFRDFCQLAERSGPAQTHRKLQLGAPMFASLDWH